MDIKVKLKEIHIYVKCENPKFVLERYEMQKSGSSMLAVHDIASSFNHCCCIHGDDQKFHKSRLNLLQHHQCIAMHLLDFIQLVLGYVTDYTLCIFYERSE